MSHTALHSLFAVTVQLLYIVILAQLVQLLCAKAFCSSLQHASGCARPAPQGPCNNLPVSGVKLLCRVDPLYMYYMCESSQWVVLSGVLRRASDACDRVRELLSLALQRCSSCGYSVLRHAEGSTASRAAGVTSVTL